ncbi:hypothetical protein BB560_002755, partial [Smittium megazygosporum]
MSSPTVIALLSKCVKFSAMNLSKKSKIAFRFLNQAKYMSFGDTQSLIEIPEDVVEKINSILIEQSIPSSETIALAPKKRPKNNQRDIYNVCVAGNQYKAELDSMPRDHLKLNDLQRKALRKQQLDLDTDSCMIIADFKGNFRIGGGP